MAPRKTKSAGARLTEELSQPTDSYSVVKLIERAAQHADWLEKLDGILSGSRSEWIQLRINRDQVIEVQVDNALREARQLTTELRHLLAEIHRQRAGIPMGNDDDDDVTAGL